MTTPHEVIKARLEEHDTDGDLLGCPAQFESLVCCVDKKIFDNESTQWIDNPFRVALDMVLDNSESVSEEILRQARQKVENEVTIMMGALISLLGGEVRIPENLLTQDWRLKRWEDPVTREVVLKIIGE